jgi:thiosulfate dehydrogenase
VVRFFTALIAAAALAGCGQPDPVIVQGTAVDHGKALFGDPTIIGSSINTFACVTCHDTSPPTAGAPLKTGAMLAGVTRRPSYWGGAEVDLLRSINACLYYFMLADTPWKADEDRAQALYAYLDSLSARPEDEAAVPFTVVNQVVDVPHGDAKHGATIYNRACKSCHGEVHTGDGRSVPRAPALPDQTLSQHPPDKYTPQERRLVFIEKTRHGGFLGYGGQMPPFSLEVLPDADMSDMLTFLGVDF